MGDKLLKLIMVHLSYLDQLKNLSEKLEIFYLQDQLDSLYHFSLNRERLIKIIQIYEVKIHNYSSKNNRKTLKNSYIEILKEWKKEKSLIIEKIEDGNKNLINQLIKNKETVKMDLSNIFKMNQFHNAYLTHSLKL